MTGFSARNRGPGSEPTVSVVIPTRNREESLARTLGALARQDERPDEVIVVDASDRPVGEDGLRARFPDLPITLVTEAPGLCRQRNVGIRAAKGSHVLLLDDDIEPPPDYLARLVGHVMSEPGAGVVTGVVREPGLSGEPDRAFEVPSFRHLLFAFLFQLTVWGDVASASGGIGTARILEALKGWYRRRGNTWSLAGWPLVTQVGDPVVRTALYGLGASLVRRDWLLASPYDERLWTHGVGDHYGVALGFPGEGPVHVLTDLIVPHHKVDRNRLRLADSHYHRVLALDYFLRTSGRFGRAGVAWLAWSLCGNALRFALRGRWALLRTTLRALVLVATGRNPLLRIPASGRPPEPSPGAGRSP